MPTTPTTTVVGVVVAPGVRVLVPAGGVGAMTMIMTTPTATLTMVLGWAQLLQGGTPAHMGA